MKILITNDDGINAPGIKYLALELGKSHEIVIVAPREQKSAASHSISIHEPIKVKEENLEYINCKAYSVLGTPADCTQVGLKLLKEKFDVVVSGINKGLNSGTDILYSGTVSAAVEAALYNVPSLAVSLEVNNEKDDEDYTIAAKWASKIVETMKRPIIDNNVVLNLNIPNIEENEIKGLKICKVGVCTYKNEYILVEDNDDKTYKIKGTRNDILDNHSDIYYLKKGYITLTPLQYDFTNYKLLNKLEDNISEWI